jgi:hypothetical protein
MIGIFKDDGIGHSIEGDIWYHTIAFFHRAAIKIPEYPCQ